MTGTARVRTGLDRLAEQSFAPLRGLKVGLVTHPAAVDGRLRHAGELLAAAPGVHLAALFGPEHGLTGEAQDLVGVPGGADSGLRVHSLYGDTFDSLQPTEEQLRGLDALVIDLQDVGSRYYTFQATMLFCVEAAARLGLKAVVLDRPNPLGGAAVEGPTLRPGYESFVGIHPVVTRHGLTVGELARLYQAERGIGGDVEVVPCEGWRRDADFDRTGLPWVLPSPNMPTLDTAFVYPGQCLLEGTNLSEGRGTTRPFELCGGPGVDARKLCQRLRDEGWPGVAFRPARFRPTFQKHAGRTCGGLQLHVTDREAFRPVRTGLAVLAALRDLSGEAFAWRREPYEFVADKPAIDLLFGSDRERLALEAGAPAQEIGRAWEIEEEAFRQRRKPYLLY
ncbi:MAG TPA: DUF1343 domain-containing protein [Gemmataceae bacterium]|nr:DUF1343 domain-containing protein [Gemmataceae bacterium]